MLKYCNNDVLDIILNSLSFEDKLSCKQVCFGFNKIISFSLGFDNDHLEDNCWYNGICKNATDHMLTFPDVYIGLPYPYAPQNIRVMENGKIKNIVSNVTEGNVTEANVTEAEFTIFKDLVDFAISHTKSSSISSSGFIVVTIQDNRVTFQFDSLMSLSSTVDPNHADIELMCGNSCFNDYTMGEKIKNGYIKNGYTALVVANIFSKYFTVNMFDYQRNIHYLQTWSNNSKKVCQPVIELNHKPNSGYSYGSKMIITYELDPTHIELGNPDATRKRFEAYLCDRAMTDKVKIVSHTKYNNSWSHQRFNPITIQEYANLYYIGHLKNYGKAIYWKSVDTAYQIEFCIIPSKNNELNNGLNYTNNISFANGCHTRSGGTHVDAIRYALKKYLKKHVETKVITVSDSIELVRTTEIKLKIPIIIFISVWLKVANFGNQAKTFLVSPINFDIPDEVFAPILKW